MSTISKIRGILFILVATSVALLVTIVIYSQEQIIQQSSIIETERIVKINQLASRIDLIIANAEKILVNAAKDENIRNSPVSSIDNDLHGIPESVDNEKRIVIRNILSTYPDFESIAYILPNGDIYFVEPYDLQKTLSVSNVSFRNYYKAVTTTHDIYVDSILVSAASHHPVAVIAVPIFSKNSSMVGMLASGVDLHTIQKRLSELHSYPDERILVVDNNRALVADSAETGNKSGEIVPEMAALQDALAGKNGTTVESINGQRMFLSYHSITAGQNTWAIVSMQPYDEAFQSVNATIQESYILAILILIITSISSYYLYRGFQAQRRMTEELESANQILRGVQEELKKVDKSKEEFAAMVSHELKTPLVPIQGYAELLANGRLGDMTEKQREAVRTIHDNAIRLSRLVQDMLDVRKMELGRLRLDIRDTSTKEIIDDCLEAFKTTADTKKISLVDSSQDVPIKCDPERILQVLNNIVNNAMKFVYSGKGQIEISTVMTDGSVTFSVKDNGIGIPKEKQAELFRKFYQVDTSLGRKAGGSGLGLAISKGIIEAHGGKIWVESEEGKGTTVYFSIPKEVGHEKPTDS